MNPDTVTTVAGTGLVVTLILLAAAVTAMCVVERKAIADGLAAIGKGGYRAAGWVGTQVRRALVAWQTRKFKSRARNLNLGRRNASKVDKRQREEDEHYDGIHAITLTPPAEDLADPPTVVIPAVWPARDRALARWEQVKAQHQVRMDEARARGIRLLADRGPVTQEFARIVEHDTGHALADVGPAEWTQADLFEVK